MIVALELFVYLLLAAATIFGTWTLFEKAGKVGFTSVVPLIREIEFLEIVNKPWWWIFPLLCTYSGLIGFLLQRSVATEMQMDWLFIALTIIGAVFWLLVMLELAKAFGKSKAYGIGLFILPFVFYPMLALTGEYQIEQDLEQKMSPGIIKFLNAGLAVLAIFLAYSLYLTVMEPIIFEKIKFKRYCAISERLEQVREAELAYKGEFGYYTGDFDVLSAFVDTGRVTIYERKDSSFMFYNRVYQKDMNKDTVITRIIGYQKVSELFGAGFEGNMLRKVPFTDDAEFELGAGKISRNGVTVPVFEVKVDDVVIFEDKMRRFKQFIDKTHDLKIGSLTEATISGNYENTKCKDGNN